MFNVVLLGFMGTGKTAVGREVAKILNMNFIDTDEIIEKRCGMTINEIFAKLNEKFFRQQERQVIEEVSKLKNCVISTGGGAVLDPANIKNLRAHGILICLSATPEEIHRRTKGKTHRPLLNLPNVYERIVDLMTYREPFYAVADYIIDTTDLSIKEVVDEVIDFLRRRGGKLEN